MKVHYSSDDGKVGGYGDEGKAEVEAYEADPWTAWQFPWERSVEYGGVAAPNGVWVPNPYFSLSAVAFSRMVPVIQEMAKDADRAWGSDWRERNLTSEYARYHGVAKLEAILQETLDAGRQ